MITTTFILLLIGAVVEILAMCRLLFWWQDLRYDMAFLKQEQAKCYVCITGASVTSFKNPKLCDKHTAHWVLIHDLEEMTREELG